MFLKQSLINKIERSLQELNNEDEKVREIHKKKISFGTGTDKISFSKDHRCFNEDDIREKARKAKKYVKELIDPDILEIRQKRWNNSTYATKNEKPEFKKILFEVRNGLKDFNVVKIKDEANVELGTDSRNAYYYGWNSSSLFEGFEKKKISEDNLELAKKNTLDHWKNETMHGHSVVKYYLNPTTRIEQFNNKLRNIKKEKSEEREKIRETVLHENPGSIPEKIDSLVYQRMFETIRKELNSDKKKNIYELQSSRMPQVEKNTDLKANLYQSECLKKSKDYGLKFLKESGYKYEIPKIYNVREKFQVLKENRSYTSKEKTSLPRKQNNTISNNMNRILPPNENHILPPNNTDEKNFEFTKSLSVQKNLKKRKNKKIIDDSGWIKREYYHPGALIMFEEDKHPHKAYSCCLSAENSKGCHTKVINTRKWNLEPI